MDDTGGEVKTPEQYAKEFLKSLTDDAAVKSRAILIETELAERKLAEMIAHVILDVRQDTAQDAGR